MSALRREREVRQTNKRDEPYSIDEAGDVLLESVLQWKAQRRRLQSAGSMRTSRTRGQWLGDFVEWLREREWLGDEGSEE